MDRIDTPYRRYQSTSVQACDLSAPIIGVFDTLAIHRKGVSNTTHMLRRRGARRVHQRAVSPFTPGLFFGEIAGRLRRVVAWLQIISHDHPDCDAVCFPLLSARHAISHDNTNLVRDERAERGFERVRASFDVCLPGGPRLDQRVPRISAGNVVCGQRHGIANVR